MEIAGAHSRVRPQSAHSDRAGGRRVRGLARGAEGKLGSFDPVRFFEFLGTLFVNLLKMLIVPLISSSIITSVAALGSGRDLGAARREDARLLRDHDADRDSHRAAGHQRGPAGHPRAGSRRGICWRSKRMPLK